MSTPEHVPRLSVHQYQTRYLGIELVDGVNNWFDTGSSTQVGIVRSGSRYYPSEAGVPSTLALKAILLPGYDPDESMEESFLTEVQAYERIKAAGSHPHIVSFYGAFIFGYNRISGRHEARRFRPSSQRNLTSTWDFNPYFGGIWIDRCNDGTLKDWLYTVRLSEPIAVRIFRQVGAAIRFLRPLQLIQSDIRDHNIGISVDNPAESFRCQLFDFSDCQLDADEPWDEDQLVSLILELIEQKGLQLAEDSRLGQVLKSIKEHRMTLSQGLELLA